MKKMAFTHDDVDNITVDWWTPPWIFERLGLEFDLDPAAPIGGVPWLTAKESYWLPKADGLMAPWFGRVWLNPPYGRETKDWLRRMDIHRNGVALVFARTDCGWFHDYVAKADAVLFLKGRVKFVDAQGLTGGNGAGAGSMLVAWGHENVAALASMTDCGKLVMM